MELKEWIVTLHHKEDLESFYEDMETPGGNLYIPDRAVDVTNRRNISRNTHYMLTHDEAMLIKDDERVWDVELAELLDLATRPSYVINNADFDKSWSPSATDVNWGLLRHSEATNRSNWGDGGTTQITDSLTITASGKNVDVVIVDGHIDPDHPEFAVNSDGSGGSRVVQFNWFSLTNAVTGGSNGTYIYDRSGSYTNTVDRDDNNHGCHCAGTVAGNSQGWARDANIYNISPYSTNPNSLSSSLMWDYIRAWHNSKPINAETGRRNPTVTNNSYGSSFVTGGTLLTDGYDSGNITRINFRGTDYNPGRDLTVQELNDRGCYGSSTSGIRIPYYSTARFADIQDAMDDGIIVVASAGNEYWKTVNSTDQDYDNTYFMTLNGSNYIWYLHRGTSSGAGYGPVINVGAMGNDNNEDKAVFSNCGSQVDIFAAGEAIQSSLHTGTIQDPRDTNYYFGKYQGTSMSGPQVAGVLACLAESWPNMTQTEAHAWVVDNAADGLMFDTGTDDATDVQSLQGAPNKILRWINQRTITGSSFPQKNFRPRPTSGVTYPRTRIRRRG